MITINICVAFVEKDLKINYNIGVNYEIKYL